MTRSTEIYRLQKNQALWNWTGNIFIYNYTYACLYKRITQLNRLFGYRIIRSNDQKYESTLKSNSDTQEEGYCIRWCDGDPVKKA